MKIQALGSAVDSTAVAAQTAVNLITAKKTPLMPGRKVNIIGLVNTAPATTAGVAKIQGSDDGTTYVDLVSITTNAGLVAEVTLYNYMRLNVTTAWSAAGTINAYIAADSV